MAAPMPCQNHFGLRQRLPQARSPRQLSLRSINELFSTLKLPKTRSIKRLPIAGAYHDLYEVTWPVKGFPADIPKHGLNENGTFNMILRVAGNHLPVAKSSNEVAVMIWVTNYFKHNHPEIPRFIPSFLYYSNTARNPIGYEYILMEKVPGVNLGTVYNTLSEEDKRKVANQLARIVTALHRCKMGFHGGLVMSKPDECVNCVAPGPIIELESWTIPKIASYWGGSESPGSLNVSGPFKFYSDYVTAVLRKQIYAIGRHWSLESMRKLTYRLNQLICFIAEPWNRELLNETTYALAHKDLHCGNILWDPQEKTITAILDWEFAAIVPAFLWDSANNCLWGHGPRKTSETKQEWKEIMEVFMDACREYSDSFNDEIEGNELQKAVQRIIESLQRMIKCILKDNHGQDVEFWRSYVESALDTVLEDRRDWNS